MDENQLAGQGYIHHQYGHQQDEYQQHQQHQQHFDPQASYDNYSSQQHHLQHHQYSPEYSGESPKLTAFCVSVYLTISGCFVKSEPEDFKYSSSSYEQQYYGKFTLTLAIKVQNLRFLHQNKPAKLVGRQTGDHLVLAE